MFEDLIEKLKASIEELRRKLPGGGGSDDDDDEYEDDEEYEEKYHGDDEDEDDDGKTVKVQIKDLLKEGANEESGSGEKTQKIYSDSDDDDDEYDEDEDEEDDDAAAAAAAKRKKIILYGAVLALLGVFLLDPQEEEAPAPVKVVKKKKRVRKKPRKKPKAVAEKPAKKAEPTVMEEKPKIVDIPPETPAEVIKPIDLSEPEKVEPVVAVAPTPTPAPTPDPKPEPPKVVKPMGESTAGQVDSGLDLDIGNEPILDSKKEKKSLESMIEKKTEYIAPPNYERSGRGLVYNCVAKHWACVDKFSYLTCRENTKWSTENAKPAECVTKNVYATLDDCVTIQKHYIEKSEPVDFCNGALSEDGKGEDTSLEDGLKLLE